MIIEWANTFKVDFDLDQAQEDYNQIMYWNPSTYAETAIYDAVEANWYCDGEEYIDTNPAIEIAAKALRERIGGVQMKMELD